MRKTNYLIMTLLVVALFFYLPQSAKAQTTGIKISPVIFEALVDPGEELSLEIKVSNSSDNPKKFYAHLRDFGPSGEAGQAKLLPPGTAQGYSLASWVDISSEGFDFGPGEQKVIKYKVKVPVSAGPGGYRGAILFGTEPPNLNVNSEEKGAGMSFAQQTASLLFLQVKGEVEERASVMEFNTDKDFYSTPFKVNFVIRIENSGNVHVKPHGTVKIVNMFGKEKAVIRVNEKGGNILPNSIRGFNELAWEGGTAFGKYTASLGLSYGIDASSGGQGKSSLVAVKTFWIIPWRIIVPLLLGLLFLLVLSFLLLKLYKNRAVKKAMEQAGLTHVKYVKKYQGPSPALHLGMILLVSFVILIFLIVLFFFIFFA